MKFEQIEVGDIVTRMLCGTIPMKLKVTEVTDDKIVCGWWDFARHTGIEIDDEISVQVSHLVRVEGARK